MKKITHTMMLLAAFGLATASFSVACGGSDETKDDDDPDPPPPPPPGPCDTITNAKQLAECHQDAVCSKLTQCGLGNLGDNSCDDVVPGFFLLEGIGYQIAADVQVAIDEGRTSFDAAAAAACVAQITDSSCLGLFVNEGNFFGGACENILVGQGAPGDDCSSEFECDNGYCQGGKGGTGDTCEPAGECVAFAADGASCTETPCRRGSYCTAGVCTTGAAGSSCYGDGCDEGFECVSNALVAGAPGICQAIDTAEEGDACENPGNFCDSSYALICLPATQEASTGTCKPLPSTAGALCVELCDNNLACVYAEGNEFGQCSPLSSLPDVGDECDPEKGGLLGGSCGLFLTCQPGEEKGDPFTCQNRGAEGDPCNGGIRFASTGGNFGSCNIGLFCSSEIVNSPNPICTKPGAAGAFCEYDGHCAEGTCGPSGTCGEAVACEGLPF